MSAVPKTALLRLFDGFEPDPGLPQSGAAQKAVYLARALQQRASALQTRQERRQQAELDRMIQHPGDKATLVQMTDQAFRCHAGRRAVDQLIHILDVQGIPRFFSPWDRTMLKGFQAFAGTMPGLAVPFVKHRIQRETETVILPAEQELLAPHLEARWHEGVRMNVNLLGEAILGEDEARDRFERYLQALQIPEIEVISVKISTIDSQISALARKHTIDRLCDKLARLFRAAGKGRFVYADGREVPKFVYLDMEEYRDLALTAEAFMRTLDRHGLENVSAGIALQAYIPDAFRWQQRINAWARDRVDAGRAPITLRIVKGANMEMERVDASLHGWPQAPYQTKLETDANYKRMLHEALKPENLAAVRPGIASHNLFELAYGLVLAMDGNALDRVQLEMLEGMANHQRRAVFEHTGNMLLYAPASRREDFIYAIGYLIRRLDENTGPENFLRHAFKLEVGSQEWKLLETGFLQSFNLLDSLSSAPRRTQDRRRAQDRRAPERRAWANDSGRTGGLSARAGAGVEAGASSGGLQCAGFPLDGFVNEPDTDFSLPHNTQWAEQIVAQWLPRCGDLAAQIPLRIAGREIRAERAIVESTDPSRPGTVVVRYRQATCRDLEATVACAKEDPAGWRSLEESRRRELLLRVGHALSTARAALLGAALVEGGKTLTESDPEVSEAIDFIRLYSATADAWRKIPGLRAEGRGVVVVVSPWNFPIAIPCGGVAAALAAGNTVLLKPASDTVLTADTLCQCFWRAGVPREALQMVPCAGAEVGSLLVAHPDVDTVILTGGTKTAQRMLRANPAMRLLAETGGKNTMIVTAMSDRDQAIKHILQSAFGHAGQKCSATSLLILETEVYEDETFKRSLCDAVRSIPVGPAHVLATRMGPMIRPPSGDLERALSELEPGESWAVMPRPVEGNPNLYTPGIKWGVRPGSYTHQTEFFGPLLGVMKARNLDEGIYFANTTGYGLTAGLESLDDREQQTWQQSIRAGNLYINRGTTGAIVLRQPFGGREKSALGPGIKAGGPNYVAQLMKFSETTEPETAKPEGDEPVDPCVADLLDRLTTLLQGHSAGEGGRGTSCLSKELEKQKNGPDFGVRLSADVLSKLAAAARSYARYQAEEFGRVHDHFRLVGEDNFRRYLPVRKVCVCASIRMIHRSSCWPVWSRQRRPAAGLRSVAHPGPPCPGSIYSIG